MWLIPPSRWLSCWGCMDIRPAWLSAARRLLEIARTWRPEVILLDLGMPGMDGYEVARRLRAEYGKDGMTLIALTGYGQETDHAGAQAAGFDDHLVKPVDLNALCAALERIPA